MPPPTTRRSKESIVGLTVIPANAGSSFVIPDVGIQHRARNRRSVWIPAFAGVTEEADGRHDPRHRRRHDQHPGDAVRRRRRAASAPSSGSSTQHYPRPGWVEHDAEEIWALEPRLRAGDGRAGGRRRSGSPAIGITNQRETIVFWSRGDRAGARARRSSGRTGAPPICARGCRGRGPRGGGAGARPACCSIPISAR